MGHPSDVRVLYNLQKINIVILSHLTLVIEINYNFEGNLKIIQLLFWYRDQTYFVFQNTNLSKMYPYNHLFYVNESVDYHNTSMK